MKALQRKDLEQLIAGSAEPVVVAQIDSADWPVVFCNPAFEGIAGKEEFHKKPFADVVEKLVGRDLALEISETIRAGQETTLPVALRDREYLLVLKPLNSKGKDNTKFYAGYLRASAGAQVSGIKFGVVLSLGI